jgi:hypothetical protein
VRAGKTESTASRAVGVPMDHGIASYRAFAGSVPTIGITSGPTQGHGLPAGHHVGFACR